MRLGKVLQAEVFSWKYVWMLFFLLLMFLGVFWLIGVNQRPVEFKFIENNDQAYEIEPVDWAWWRELADKLHGRKYIMLTFDDGPSDPSIDTGILRVLKKHHAHAVFFTICSHADTISGRRAIRNDVADGNLIGVHTYSHPHLPTLDKADVRHQVHDCQVDLEKITDQKITLFRPPFGQQNRLVLDELKSDGLLDVLWGANSEDSMFRKHKNLKFIEYWAVKQSYDGSILLMHSDQATEQSLDSILSHLENKGYVFVLPKVVG